MGVQQVVGVNPARSGVVTAGQSDDFVGVVEGVQYDGGQFSGVGDGGGVFQQGLQLQRRDAEVWQWNLHTRQGRLVGVDTVLTGWVGGLQDGFERNKLGNLDWFGVDQMSVGELGQTQFVGDQFLLESGKFLGVGGRKAGGRVTQLEWEHGEFFVDFSQKRPRVFQSQLVVYGVISDVDGGPGFEFVGLVVETGEFVNFFQGH